MKTNKEVIEALDNSIIGRSIYYKGFEAGKSQATKELLEEVNKWEKKNTEVLTTEKLKADKIIIADYIKWDKFRELKAQLSKVGEKK